MERTCPKLNDDVARRPFLGLYHHGLVKRTLDVKASAPTAWCEFMLPDVDLEVEHAFFAAMNQSNHHFDTKACEISWLEFKPAAADLGVEEAFAAMDLEPATPCPRKGSGAEAMRLRRRARRRCREWADRDVRLLRRRALAPERGERGRSASEPRPSAA